MEQVLKYFQAERAESIVFFLIGVLSISVGTYAYFWKNTDFWRGFALPFAFIALIQLGVGLSIYLRTPKDIAKVETMFRTSPTQIQTEEIPRMKAVMRSFVIIRYVEIALLISGLILYFLLDDRIYWKGLGTGLAIQAGVMLLADYFAESRGRVYIDFLNAL